MAKKNFRKIPDALRAKLARITTEGVLVGCVRKLDDRDIQQGVYRRLGIPINPNGPKVVETIPPATAGKFSDINVNGEVIIRYDLPKETHFNYIESPNWGDESNGTHEVALPYERYPRDFIAPRNAAIVIELLSNASGFSIYKFTVNEVVRKKDEKRIFECLNLLQENVGAVDVFPSDHDFSKHAQTIQIAWEILPPGQRDKVLARLVGGRGVSPEQQRQIEDRYTFLLSLQPKEMLVGSSGMQRYLGGMIRSDLVVFENIEYGNAAYVMYDNWEQLSKRSRLELLSGRFGKNFDRVVHSEGWKGKVKDLVTRKMNN